jgi:signal peptide peptidase SppA
MDKNQMQMLATILPDGLWAGTEGALHALITRMLTAHERPIPEAALITSGGLGATKKDEPVPYLFSRKGNIGVIEIKGPMTNATSYWDRYDKAATYPAIRDALVHAVNDPEVKTILLDIESGGGAVAGMFDAARFIRGVNDNIKPVVAFGETIYSAAYCLGSSAGQIFTSNAGEVGSIGVIATHMDYSKMYADMGVNVTVMRSGKYKALANRMEPLSDDARKQMQASMDAKYEVFVQHVADMRRTTYPKADANMAQGREFFGSAAKDAGLVDAITTYDALLAVLQESVDKQHPF